LALSAVIKALRMDPDEYAVIYNCKYDNNGIVTGQQAGHLTYEFFITILIIDVIRMSILSLVIQIYIMKSIIKIKP
jgi:hypothetical protein